MPLPLEEKSEVTTGKHGDKGRYVTTENGSQIFLTQDGQIGQTGKSIDGEMSWKPVGQPKSTAQSPAPQDQPGESDDSFRQASPRPKSFFVQSFADSIIENIRKFEREQQQPKAAAPNPQDHPHAISKLPIPMRQSLLNWEAEINTLTQTVGRARHGARGNDPKGVMKAAFDQIDKTELGRVMGNLQKLIAVGDQQGVNLRPFIRHNNLVPRELAPKLKPSDLFNPVQDHERYRADSPSLAARFTAVISEHYAALSQSTLRNLAGKIDKPTEGQIETGNYRKGHIRTHGLDITIENAKGTRRRPEWPPLAAHYGYIKRTLGRDGDHVDVFIGPNVDSELVVVVDQVSQGGRFDEHKCLIGFSTTAEAVATYRKCYTSGWKVGPVTTMTIGQFKSWLKSGDQTKRLSDQVSKYAAAFSDILREHYAAKFDESKHARDESGQFTTVESHDTPAGKVEIRHRSSKGVHPLEGMKDDPAFRNMPYFEHDFEVTVGGKTRERIRRGGDSDSMDIGIDDARFESNKIRKQAAKKGEVVSQGKADVTTDDGDESISWKIEHDGRGSFRATVGDWYSEEGLGRKGAEKAIKNEIDEHVKANSMQYAATQSDVVIDRLIAAEMGITVEEYAARKAKNSPGQMSLFGDGLGGDTPLRTASRQQRLDWDESLVKRDPEGKFAEKAEAKADVSEAVEATKNEHGAHVITPDDIGGGGDGTFDQLHAGLASEIVQSKIAIGMKGIEGREYAIMQTKGGKWQLASRKAETAKPESPDVKKIKELIDKGREPRNPEDMATFRKFAESVADDIEDVDKDTNLDSDSLRESIGDTLWFRGVSAPDNKLMPIRRLIGDILRERGNVSSEKKRRSETDRKEQDRKDREAKADKYALDPEIVNFKPRFSFDQHVKIAADSIDKLRKSDVYRLIETVPDTDTAKMVADMIGQKRPDLKDEAMSSLFDYLQDAPTPGKYSASIADMVADRLIAAELGLTVEQYAARKKPQKGQQEFEWITVNADKGKGQPVMIDKKDGTILAGMGGKFDGQKIGEIGKKGGDAKAGDAKKDASRGKGDGAKAKGKPLSEMTLAEKLKWQKENPGKGKIEMPKKPKPKTMVDVSGASYEFIENNKDGTIKVRNDQGDTFNTEQGEEWKVADGSKSSADAPKGQSDKEKIADYLSKNPKATVGEISKATGIKGRKYGDTGDPMSYPLNKMLKEMNDNGEIESESSSMGSVSFSAKAKPAESPDKRIEDAIAAHGGHEATSADNVDAIRNSLYKSGKKTPSHADIREAMQNMRNKAGEQRKPEATAVSPDEIASLKAKDRFTDSSGQEYEIHKSRFGTAIAHPIVNGQPQVNRDSGVAFSLDDNAKAKNPDHRIDIQSVSKWTNPDAPSPGSKEPPAKPAAEAKAGVDSYTQSMSPMAAASAKKALEKKKNYDGKVKTVAQAIDDALSGGGKLTTHEYNKPVTPKREDEIKIEMGQLRRNITGNRNQEEKQQLTEKLGKLGRSLRDGYETISEDMIETPSGNWFAAQIGRHGINYAKHLESTKQTPEPAPVKTAPQSTPAPAPYEPPTIPGQQTSLFGGDDLNTGQKSLFNMARPSKADQRAAKRGEAPPSASLLEQIDDEEAKRLDSRKSLPGQRDMFRAQFEAAMIEQYRAPAAKKSGDEKKKSKRPKATIGNKGDRGRFITTENGDVVFLEGKMQADGNIDTSQAVARKRREKAKHTDPDRFVPVNDEDHEIVRMVGDKKKDVAYFKKHIDEAHREVGTRYREDADAMREVLAQFGYTGKKLSGFLSSLKRRRGDTSNIAGFDEMLDYAQKHHRQLLTARPGESAGAGDEESMFYERLKAGFPPAPKRSDPEVIQAARGMSGIDQTGLPSEWDAQETESEPDDEWDDVPFSASPLAVTERYAATFSNAFKQTYRNLATLPS